MKTINIPLMICGLCGFFVCACAGEAFTPREPASPANVEPKNAPPPEPAAEPGRSFDEARRWELTDPTAVKALQNTPFGEQEIKEFWARKGWRLTQKEDRYLAAIDRLVQEGAIKKTAHWSRTPFTPVYTANQSISIEGFRIPADTEFWMDPNENEDRFELGTPTFGRTDGYKEEHEGHIDQASDSRVGENRASRRH
ncbi:MAG TPA: hypothetical protein VIF62_29115 [Labilithrix sp.]